MGFSCCGCCWLLVVGCWLLVVVAGTRGLGLWFRAGSHGGPLSRPFGGEGGDQRGDGARVDGVARGRWRRGRLRECLAWRTGTTSAAMRTAAALSRTTSRRGPGSPAKMARRMAALVAASPPRRVSMGAEARPNLLWCELAKGDGGRRALRRSELGRRWRVRRCQSRLRRLRRRLPVNDEGVAHAEQEHGLGDDGDEAGGVDTHDLGAGSGGVGERAGGR